MTDFTPRTHPFTGRRAALIIVAFFGVIIAVNGLMLTLAVKTFGGLVVGNSYVASQNFDADIATAQAQPIRGWQIAVTPRAQRVEVMLTDRDGSPLAGLDTTLTIARPTHDRSTLVLPLAETAPGVYAATAHLEAGQWIGTVSTADGQTRSLTFIHERPRS